jgi:hypothetical protein
MRRLVRLLPSVAAAALCVGAKGNEAASLFVVGGVAAALLVLLGLPVGLLLHSVRREFLVAESRALERRGTACVLVGAGLVFATAFVAAVLSPNAGPLAALVFVAAVVLFLVGFAGCAAKQGERMLSRASGDPSPRPLVLGWLARAGLFAVPVVWPFVGTYLVVVAFGVPVVAAFGRADETPAT